MNNKLKAVLIILIVVIILLGGAIWFFAIPQPADVPVADSPEIKT